MAATTATTASAADHRPRGRPVGTYTTSAGAQRCIWRQDAGPGGRCPVLPTASITNNRPSRDASRLSAPSAERRSRETPALRGLRRCARKDSNLHEPYGPQGPQSWRPSTARCGFRLLERFPCSSARSVSLNLGPKLGPHRGGRQRCGAGRRRGGHERFSMLLPDCERLARRPSDNRSGRPGSVLGPDAQAVASARRCESRDRRSRDGQSSSKTGSYDRWGGVPLCSRRRGAPSHARGWPGRRRAAAQIEMGLRPMRVAPRVGGACSRRGRRPAWARRGACQAP
jgi:hypothetical protein